MKRIRTRKILSRRRRKSDSPPQGVQAVLVHQPGTLLRCNDNERASSVIYGARVSRPGAVPVARSADSHADKHGNVFEEIVARGIGLVARRSSRARSINWSIAWAVLIRCWESEWNALVSSLFFSDKENKHPIISSLIV